MTMLQKTGLITLSAVMALSCTMPALADSMWVPRLGYPVAGVKRVYLDITTPDQLEEAQKARKAEEKESKKEAKALKKAAKHRGGGSEVIDPEAEVEWEALEDPKKSKKARRQAKEEARNEDRETARKRADAERSARMRARQKELEARRNSEPVDGDFFLYNLKLSRLLYDQTSKLRLSEDQTALVAPYYVEFSESPMEGLYDLAVRGSGHRSEHPLWVSDAVYWDALQPVLQDFKKAHCPRQDGKFLAVQKCYFLTVESANYPGSALGEPTHIVKGGWFNDAYQPGEQTGALAKDTEDIARTAQMLMQTYRINPEPFKYLSFADEHYAQSRYPDILDEANWGIQYLLTVQQNNGSFPAGVQAKTEPSGKTAYKVAPTSLNATALAVMALATASQVYHKEDLSLAVKSLRAAEKGWRYLQSNAATADPTALLLASAALTQVSDNPGYAQAYEGLKAQVRTINPQTALLLGAESQAFTLAADSAGEPNSAQWVMPLLVEVHQGNTGASNALAAWVTERFGYEQIPLVRDESLAVASAWFDPLQWMATKTGEVATRLGQRLSDGGIAGFSSHENLDSSVLQELEKGEAEAKKRIRRGYEQLNMTTVDRLYLAYALVLLNQQLDYSGNPEDRKQPPPPSNQEPFAPIRGHWPKPL